MKWNANNIDFYFQLSSGSALDEYSNSSLYSKWKLEKKKQEWEKLFPCELYEITDYTKVELDIKYEQKSEYNLVAAAERQREFYYDVSLPHYWNKAFQTRAIERYGS